MHKESAAQAQVPADLSSHTPMMQQYLVGDFQGHENSGLKTVQSWCSPPLAPCLER